jgi:large conductance mechanosensitive channel
LSRAAGREMIRRPKSSKGGIVKDFKAFLLRGNLVDLAVGIVIGLAFTAVVTALVASLITPLIAAIFGSPNFASLTFTINGSVFTYGVFLNALISFVLIAAVVFFLVVKPVNAFIARSKKEEEATTRPCPECLTEIPLEATRCSACTAVVGKAA